MRTVILRLQLKCLIMRPVKNVHLVCLYYGVGTHVFSKDPLVYITANFELVSIKRYKLVGAHQRLRSACASAQTDLSLWRAPYGQPRFQRSFSSKTNILAWEFVTRSCLKPQNPCSNHEIHVLFDHGFYLKKPKLGPDLNAWRSRKRCTRIYDVVAT